MTGPLHLLASPFSEKYIDTSFGRTHCLWVGDQNKPRICTIHGGNGITTLNLKLFLPLLSEFCIIAPDVIGMPGKSRKIAPPCAFRNSTWAGPADDREDDRAFYKILYKAVREDA